MPLRQRQYRPSKPYVPRGGFAMYLAARDSSQGDIIDLRTAKTASPTPRRKKRKLSEFESPKDDTQVSTDVSIHSEDATEDAAAEEYEVERIIDGMNLFTLELTKARLGRKNRVEYLVKWLGYDDPADNTVRNVHNISC